MLVQSNFAGIYKSWFPLILQTMFTQAKSQSDRLVAILDQDLQALSQPPPTADVDIAALMELTQGYQTIKTFYNLAPGNTNHRCLASIPLSWTQWTITGSAAGCCGCNCVTVIVPGTRKRQAPMCELDESTPTDASGGTGAEPTSVLSTGPTTTTTLTADQSLYPTATSIPPSSVFCYDQLQDTAEGTVYEYVAFNLTEATNAINALCNGGHTLRAGNTVGFTEEFLTPLGNGHTKVTLATVSWATNQAGCAKQASLKISGTGCVNALDAPVYSCMLYSPCCHSNAC